MNEGGASGGQGVLVAGHLEIVALEQPFDMPLPLSSSGIVRRRPRASSGPRTRHLALRASWRATVALLARWNSRAPREKNLE